MYHPGKFRGQPSVAHKQNRDTHGLHPVHLTLHASATPVAERGVRHVTPDRMTRDQATTFRPSDLPIGQTTNIRRASANSEVSSANSGATGPLRTIGFGPPGLLHTMSETRLLGNPNRRNLVSPAKAYGTEYTQFSSGDHYRRHNSLGQESEQSIASSNQPLYQDNISRTQSRIPTQSKNNPYLPGDRVIFAESPSAPGIPIVYRSAEERAANPDRLNLDRRHLTVCPILEGEEHLRLLNFQHNAITRIQHLSNLRRLIFLDLYDNHIEEMSGLSALKSLRVLMLGKNRIRNVSALENLTKLDVLDLHGNQIRDVENLSHLSELRVLNLAGNQIEHVGNLAGMETLAELNLRRNCIVTVVEVDLLPSLQRLFLSFNNISLWSDIECLGDSASLCEISLDGNPISNDVSYKQVVLKNMPHLRQLDMKRISEDERRVAALMMKKEEDRKREVHKQAIAKEKKRLAINNAARQWESEHYPVNQMWDQPISFQDSLFTQSDNSAENSPRLSEKERKVLTDYNGRQDKLEKSSWLQNNTNNNNTKIISTIPTSLDISEAYLAEIEGENLQLFGPGALESLDKNWGNQVSSSVSTLTVQFINFDDFCLYINKIRNRFPHVKNLFLKEVNLHCLQQINAISLFRKLDALSVEPGPSNPVTQFSLWKTFAIFRLSHLNLTKLNGDEIQASDVANAEKVFGSLSLVATTQLSQFRLVALMGDYKQKQATKDQKKTKPAGEPESEMSVSAESVGRSALQYIPVRTLASRKQETETRKQFSHDFVTSLTREAGDIASKQALLHNNWPFVFVDMVKDAVMDMSDLDRHVRAVGRQFESSI